MAQQVWLITGCSPGGFGEQFVHSIIARGDKVIATARSLEKIQHLQRVGAEILRLDVTESQQSIRATVNKAVGIYGHIDVLVNNAAFIQIGTWEDLEYEDFLAEFETNVFGTIKVTRALLPHFRQRRAGVNVFISSLSGWIGHEMCGAYAGSKFALEGLVESLWRETAPLGIKTLLIEPGRFRTKLLTDGNRKTIASSIPDYADLSQTKVQGLAEEDRRQPGDPVKLVEIILDLVQGRGVASGKGTPFRLPLGIDAYDEIKAKCEETLKLLDEWEPVIRSTEFVN